MSMVSRKTLSYLSTINSRKRSVTSARRPEEMIILLKKSLKIKVPEPAANNRLSFIERFLRIQLKANSFMVRN